MYCQERKADIIQLIEKEGTVDVNALAARFRTSKETIRRDLTDLERQGILKRTHGGAILEAHATPGVWEYPVGIRGGQHVAEKNSICKKAASFIRQGDTLFVDNSSTLMYLPRYISPDLNITIITNSIHFLLETSKIMRHNWLLICLGGIFRSSNLSVHGASAIKSAGEYYPNKTFFSCAGISPVNMIADSSLYEIETKQLMINRAQETFLLADRSKFEKLGQMYLCSFGSVNHIITNEGQPISGDIGKHLEQSGTKLVVV